MSLPADTSYTFINFGRSFAACASLFKMEDPENEFKAACVDGPVLNGNELVSRVGQTCTYTMPGDSQLMTKNIPSSCYYSQQGLAICPLGLGDVHSQLNYIYNNYFIHDLSSICHISTSDTTVCEAAKVRFNIPDQVQAYLNTYAIKLTDKNATPWVDGTAYIADNAACTKNIVTYQYWSLMDAAPFLSKTAELIKRCFFP